MKKIVVQIIIIFIIFIQSTSARAATLNTQMLQEEKENFGISDFIKETEQYTDEFFDDIDISDTLNSAITGKIDNNKIFKKILKIFGNEMVASIKTLVAVLTIVLIHSILKAITDNSETSDISKIIYYVQYIFNCNNCYD